MADLPKSTFPKLRKCLMYGFIHFLDSPPSMGSRTTFLPPRRRPPRIVLVQWIRFLSFLPSNDHSIPFFSCPRIYIYIYIYWNVSAYYTNGYVYTRIYSVLGARRRRKSTVGNCQFILGRRNDDATRLHRDLYTVFRLCGMSKGQRFRESRKIRKKLEKLAKLLSFFFSSSSSRK